MKVGQKKTSVSCELHPHFTHRSDISNHERLRQLRIIVPSAIRSEVKSILYQGHLGTELEDIISKRPTFLTYRNCKPNEIPTKHKIPGHPRTKCAADFFCLHGHYYLLLVNYY